MYQKNFTQKIMLENNLKKILYLCEQKLFLSNGLPRGILVLNVDTDWMVDGTTKISLRC